jgi:predicted membrane GTPase involved in stress response
MQGTIISKVSLVIYLRYNSKDICNRLSLHKYRKLNICKVEAYIMDTRYMWHGRQSLELRVKVMFNDMKREGYKFLIILQKN